jgi:hypothetical protein
MSGNEVKTEKITYSVVGFLPMRRRDRYPPMKILECVNGSPIHKYTGYDYGHCIEIYPMKGGKLHASNVPYEKKTIYINQTRRAF